MKKQAEIVNCYLSLHIQHGSHEH